MYWCVTPYAFFAFSLLGPPNRPVLADLLADTTSLYLSWEEPANNNAPILTYYITLQIVDDMGQEAPLVYSSNITQLGVDGLTPFTEYSVQLVAVNSIGSSAPSEPRTVITAEGSESVFGGMHTSILCKLLAHHMTIACCHSWSRSYS